MAIQYDLIIIGAGPGGYTAAFKAASLGLKTAVIEKDKVGGVCLNRGCIPTKALLHASSLFSSLQHCDEFGVSTDFISFDFGKMQEYKSRSVRAYRDRILELLKTSGVDFIHGMATIRRDKTVEVNSPEGKEYYQGRYIIIATGAKPVMPGIPGIDLPGVWNSDRLLASKTWNFDRLTIVGGGVIGVEFATIFNGLCSNVTIIEKSGHLLGPMDEEISKELEKVLVSKGITVYCNAKLQKLEDEGGLMATVSHGGETLRFKAGQVLMAIGREPCLDGLFGKDVEFQTKDGRLVVDKDFMTSVPDIYAIGDAAARIQLAHVASAQGTYVVEKIAGKDHSIKLSVVPSGMFIELPIIPHCIYTDPEIATVGITEATAREYQMKVRCGKYSMNGNGKSIISREDGGFIHLVFEAYSNTIVGAQIVCPRATDMIGEMATAIANGLTARQLSRAMRAHPTYGEGIAAAIEDAQRADDVPHRIFNR